MKNKRAFRIKLLIFILIAVSGAAYASIPLVRRISAERSIAREIDRYNEIVTPDKVDYSPIWELIDEYNDYVARKGSQFVVSDEEKEFLDEINAVTGGIVGVVSVPGEDIRLPIYTGLDESSLQAGAGWWEGSSLPSGGPGRHTVISAHSGLSKAKMFTGLDRVKAGDMFSITFLDRTLYYEVDQIKTVLPDDVSDLYIIPGEDHVTLYTCTPYGINTHRLLVRGKRTEMPDIDEPARVVGDAYVDFPVILVISVSCAVIIMLVILAAAAGHRSKKNRKNGGG